MIYHFTANTIKYVCHSIRSMFWVLGIYNFAFRIKILTAILLRISCFYFMYILSRPFTWWNWQCLTPSPLRRHSLWMAPYWFDKWGTSEGPEGFQTDFKWVEVNPMIILDRFSTVQNLQRALILQTSNWSGTMFCHFL